MCQYFSCIVTKDFEVHWLPEDPRDHQAIIDKFNLDDTKLERRDFVRIEISPKIENKYTRDQQDWQLKIDELGTLPQWFKTQQKKAEKQCWLAWEESVKINIAIGDEKVTIKDQFILALGNASVKALGNASVEAWGNASVKAWGNASVKAWGNASVEAWGNASVEACGNASVEACGNASVEAWDNASVKAYGNAKFSIKSRTATVIKDGQIHVLSLSNVVKVKEI